MHKCNNAPCPYEKQYKLYWQDPDTQELHFIAEDYYMNMDAAQDVISNYWDDRLDIIGCIPVIKMGE
jgi:hypothetical protein